MMDAYHKGEKIKLEVWVTACISRCDYCKKEGQVCFEFAVNVPRAETYDICHVCLVSVLVNGIG
jgi:hypothetical protein